MITVDLWAAVAASVAASAIAVRARMLRPRQRAWTPAPKPVVACLTLLGLTLGMRAVGLWCGAHSTGGEAMVDTALAICGVVMVWNLNRHGRVAEAARRQRLIQIDEVMARSGPPARYPFERGSGR